MLRSLRSRVIGGMAVLLLLVFGIAVLGVDSIRSLDRSVDQELSVLLESTDLSNGLIASLSSEVRAAEQYLRYRQATVYRRGRFSVHLPATVSHACRAHHVRSVHRK
jgi:hypothetical protein